MNRCDRASSLGSSQNNRSQDAAGQSSGVRVFGKARAARFSRAYLQEGWVIANHILVSFHVAFISSVLALPSVSILKGEVLKFIFVSPETIISAIFLYISLHTGIALHEIGHYLTAARLNALNDAPQREAKRYLQGTRGQRFAHLARLYLLTPYGKASGIKREGLNYYPDAPYNLAVAAAGPRASRNVASVTLPPAALLIAVGLVFDVSIPIYIGRLLLGIGIVTLLDFLLADPGKYAEFKQRERRAQEKAAAVSKSGDWWDEVRAVRQKLLGGRMQEITHPRLGPVTAPWQFRNCGMGGRHTEKEYPESNISMQEAMFLILSASDYQEAQEMTVRLQTRLKEIIEKEEGCRVMGIGLEGGIAPYVERGSYPFPEVRLWAMMKQTIEECGYQPGVDVAIALDPAMSELENAYREQFNMPDAVGMYLFWRDKTLAVLDRDEVLDLYMKAIREYNIPILSIEDGFSERDFEGWKNILKALGDRVFVIGDDLVTTNDQTIELAAAKGMINTSLIKANQIGSLYETILAMLVALGKGQDLVVSHRSKSPNDDMEAQIALAVNALGLKAGGGANTERLVKYQAVNELMRKGIDKETQLAVGEDQKPTVRRVHAYEEPTNAGIPTVGATVEFVLPEAGVSLKFRGSTPLGTSAGSGEAIHLVDSNFERAEHREVIERFPDLFREIEPGVHAFKKQVKESEIKRHGDDMLTALFARAQRYEGKGCLNAVDNVLKIIAPAFTGQNVAGLTLKDVDCTLLSVELRVAKRRGKLEASASQEDCIRVMQRKQNLGMNAMLSVSLALARGVAHLNGKDLYEMIREEMFSIIEQLAGEHRVEIEGSRFSDYIDSLQNLNRSLEAEGKQLYDVLRDVTGIYRIAMENRDEGLIKTSTKLHNPVDAKKNSKTEKKADLTPPKTNTPSIALGEEDLRTIQAVNSEIFKAFGNGADNITRREALHRYVTAKRSIAGRTGHFGIVNNRIFKATGKVLIPYLVGETLRVHSCDVESDEVILTRRIPNGTILTDDYVGRLSGAEGEPVDLEKELFDFDVKHATPVRVGRIRDMAEQLKIMSQSANRNDSLYILRILVARLSLFSFRKFLNAKNLQTEVSDLLKELMRFLNTSLSNRLPFLVRILVRNIAGVVTKPKVIDRLWNDTIDLAEVHVRGSDIVNEIRRSSHHAVGKRTLVLTEAYLQYLENGDTEGLSQLGFPKPAPADEEARKKDEPKRIVAEIVSDLERLLGSSEIVERLREWQADYEATLVRCEFGKNLLEEVEEAVTKGINERNQWVYYHHVRIIKTRVLQFSSLAEVGEDFDRRLSALLELKPSQPDFDADGAEAELRRCVDEIIDKIKTEYYTALFNNLESFLTAYNSQAFFETFIQISNARKSLRTDLNQGAFPEQRLQLYQLDCLLEEMGYLAMRHVASEYEEKGVDLDQCLRVIHACVQNLTHDGLHSRQLGDLAGMMMDKSKTYAEMMNVLEQIHRNYHHILQRLFVPFERMREKLELDEEELRISLANMQRYLHDLNSMATFTDMARAHIEKNIPDCTRRIDGGDVIPRSEKDVLGEIVHLSHRDEIEKAVERDETELNLRECYGGKGSGLIYISYLDVPTRDGFILPTGVARHGLLETDGSRLDEEIVNHLKILEADIEARDGVGKQFGSRENPLLLAVRGGSVFSMPGILFTVLFVGMNDEIAAALAKEDPWYAYDSYRRFLASYAQAVWDVNVEKFNIVDDAKRRYQVKYKDDLPWEGMKEVAESTKAVLEQQGYGEALEELLNDPMKQLFTASRAVFKSWNCNTARRYREIKGICDTWQTAAIIQEMASGNRKNDAIRVGMDETRASLTGVIPRTCATDLGVRESLGDFKFSAAGDDLVGGLTKSISFHPMNELGTYMPFLSRRLRHLIAKLRRFMGTDQEIEFTVERGVLSVLQARAAEIGANKHTATFENPGADDAKGIGIRGGGFRGVVAFDEDDLKELSAQDFSSRKDVDGVMMVVENPTPEDIPVILSAQGLLAVRGGSTSHAAIAINGIEDRDFSAVMSASDLQVTAREHEAVIVNEDGTVRHRIKKGDIVSIHGTTGAVYVGSRPLIQA